MNKKEIRKKYNELKKLIKEYNKTNINDEYIVGDLEDDNYVLITEKTMFFSSSFIKLLIDNEFVFFIGCSGMNVNLMSRWLK